MTGPQLAVDLTLPRAGFQLAVDLQLDLTGTVGLFGASGSGKTSLLRALAGLEPQARGTLRLDEIVIQGANVCLPPWQRRFALVFQDPQLFDHRRVLGNLQFAGRDSLPGARISLDDVVPLLDLEGLLERRTQHLSGGEKRRVAIAQALLSQPRLLLLDEPLSGLDEAVALDLSQRLKRCFADLALPVIIVSHRIEELLRMSRQMVMLAAGQVVASGATRDLACDLALPLAHAQDARAILTGTVIDHDPDYQLSRLRLGSEHLYLPDIRANPGATIEVVVAARDVSITRHKPVATSILNILQARVSSIADTGPVLCTVRLQTDGQTLLAQVTRKSAAALALRAGDQVWAQIKSAVLAG